MTCKDVRKSIEDNAIITKEIETHLKTCPACRQMAQSTKMLNHILKSAKNEFPETSFIDFKTKIENKPDIKENLMNKIKNELGDRPKLAFGLGLAIVVFLFITLVPFSYKIQSGYDLIISNDQPIKLSQQDLDFLKEASGCAILDMRQTTDKISFVNLLEKREAITIATAFKLLFDMELDYNIKPVYNTVFGSLYAQAKDKMMVDVKREDKTVSEIAREIEEQLSEYFKYVKASVDEIDGDKVVVIDVESDENSQLGNQKFELRIVSGLDEDIHFEINTLKSLPVLNIDMTDKTDDEIIAETKAKLAKEGKSNAKVKIVTNTQGKKEIKIVDE